MLWSPEAMPRYRSVSPFRHKSFRALAVPLRESVRKDVFPHDGRTADEKPGNVPPYADDGHRYPLSSFSHDGIAMVRKPGVTMPDFSALPHRATLSLVLSRNEACCQYSLQTLQHLYRCRLLMNRRFATDRHHILPSRVKSPYCFANWWCSSACKSDRHIIWKASDERSSIGSWRYNHRGNATSPPGGRILLSVFKLGKCRKIPNKPYLELPCFPFGLNLVHERCSS